MADRSDALASLQTRLTRLHALCLLQAGEIEALRRLLIAHLRRADPPSPAPGAGAPASPDWSDEFLRLRAATTQRLLQIQEDTDPALAAELQALLDRSLGNFPI